MDRAADSHAGGSRFTEPPFLCIEILPPDDAALDVWAKVHEYIGSGVAYVWIIGPVIVTGEIHTRGGVERVDGGKFHAGEIEIRDHL